MSILYRSKRWITLAQLVPDWARELAQAESDAKRVENDLWHYLVEDIINGRLDRKRPGLAFIQSDNRAVPVEGRLLIGKLNLSVRRYFHRIPVTNRILVTKKAVLDFARRQRLPPPSWWLDNQHQLGLRRANVITAKQLAGGTRARIDHARRPPSAEPEQTENNKTWRRKPGVRLTKAQAAVLEALKALWPNDRPDHNASARDNLIINWLKEKRFTPVSSRTIQRTLKKIDPPTSRDSRDLSRPDA